VSSGMLRHVALVRTDVSEEPSASFIRVTRIGELETTLAVTSNRRTQLASVALCSSETSVLTRATQRNISEDTILQEFLNLCSASVIFSSSLFLLTLFLSR
jgi:hypothetical protein